MHLIKKFIKNLRKNGFRKTSRMVFVYLFTPTIDSFKKHRKDLAFKIIKSRSCDGLLVKKIHNYKMLLDLSDLGISKELALTGWHEKNSSTFIKKELKPGMHVVEIGANIGYYTLIEANAIGKSGYIYAFEPNEKNMRNLKVNILLNAYENNTSFYPYAIGSENKEEDFYIADFGNLSSFAKREDGLCNYRAQKVQIRRLDEVLKNEKIDYFRMDVEGYEKEVIAGMNEILSSPTAPYGMFIEVHSELLHKLNSSAREFINTLSQYGYGVKKSFYRGRSDISVNTTEELLNHEKLEKGYWETFFYKPTK